MVASPASRSLVTRLSSLPGCFCARSHSQCPLGLCCSYPSPSSATKSYFPFLTTTIFSGSMAPWSMVSMYGFVTINVLILHCTVFLGFPFHSFFIICIFLWEITCILNKIRKPDFIHLPFPVSCESLLCFAYSRSSFNTDQDSDKYILI